MTADIDDCSAKSKSRVHVECILSMRGELGIEFGISLVKRSGWGSKLRFDPHPHSYSSPLLQPYSFLYPKLNPNSSITVAPTTTFTNFLSSLAKYSLNLNYKSNLPTSEQL